MQGLRKIKPRVLAIFGSPRGKKSYSSAFHRAFLEPIRSAAVVHSFHVYTMKIAACTACGHCHTHGDCIFDDDMKRIYRELRSADMISISSPLYFSSLPGPLKILIDRCQMIWELRERNEWPVKNAHGFFISSGGADYTNMFLPSVTIIRHFFNSLRISYDEKNFLLFRGMETTAAHSAASEHMTRCGKIGRQYLSKLTGAAE